VEGVKLVAPDLVPTSFDSYRQYEHDVANALSAMGYGVAQEVAVNQVRADLQITKDERSVYAELKYYRSLVSAQTIHQIVGMAQRLSAPVILITNSRLTITAQALLDGKNVDYVQWRDKADNSQLRASIERLLVA
jgi:HJR/Mrr/RecB family endonuclease